ncbi:MAG: arylsulfatase [Verrucomicrobia bacterium]|nr:arylsulfatase [Verrucomicrobiota bacterium]
MKNILFLLAFAASGFGANLRAAPVAPRPAPPAPARPSIIFILADDLGYGDLGCYGQKKIKTPNLDRLAAEGMRFTQCYAGSTVCAPSRCALLTGRHTGHGWIRGNAKLALRPEDVTVAEVLKKTGYKTGAVGKWGLGLEDSTGTPQKKGFDQWFGYLDQTHAHNYFPDYLWRFDPVRNFEGKLALPGNEGGKRGQYSHDLFTIAATNFVRINYPQLDNQLRPFFLYLAYTIPHANNELARKSGNGMEVPGDAPYSAENWPQPEKNKAAMITRLDTDVGKLLDELKRRKVDEHTIIFFSSDNGPHQEGGNDPKFFASGGPLRGIKRDLYEGGIRVPMIARWPGKIKAGSVSDQPWAFWDFLPTAAALAQVSPPEGMDGISMLPALLGKPQKGHEFLYWEFHEKTFKQAVRMGDWKAVRNGVGEPLELYDLKGDVGEANNVAGKNPEIVEKIEAYMKTARTESAHWPVKEGRGR